MDTVFAQMVDRQMIPDALTHLNIFVTHFAQYIQAGPKKVSHYQMITNRIKSY